MHQLGCVLLHTGGCHQQIIWSVMISSMHGSIWLLPFPLPQGKPRDKSSPLVPGVRNCLKQFFPGDIKRVRQINENIFSLILRRTCKYVSFLGRFNLHKWLRTSRLRILKGKRRNLSEIGWRRLTYQYLSLYLKACFKISKRMYVWCLFEWIFLRKNERNIPSA